jgi:hypothetical protein
VRHGNTASADPEVLCTGAISLKRCNLLSCKAARITVAINVGVRFRTGVDAYRAVVISGSGLDSEILDLQQQLLIDQQLTYARTPAQRRPFIHLNLFRSAVLNHLQVF